MKVSKDLEVPVGISGRRTAIFGLSGSGKSNSATVLIENLLRADEQVVIVDPKGESWGLLSNKDGKPSDLPIIVFGEPNGHIEAISEDHGPRLADFVVDTGRSVVLSLLGFESDQSERRFVASFMRELYRKKSRQANPSRTLVVLEEAHLFIPEGAKGDVAELAGSIQRIARQGRSFGLGTLIVDQRPQDVSKRVISQCDTLICHQLVHKTDRNALSDWIKGYDTGSQGTKFLESLASLQPGEAWVWSPSWMKVFKKTKFFRRETLDTGASPDGDSRPKTIQRAEIDLDSLRGQLEDVVKKAKEQDPQRLREEIKRLNEQLRKSPAENAELIESFKKQLNQQKLEFMNSLESLFGPLEEAGNTIARVHEQLNRIVLQGNAYVPREIITREAIKRATETTNKSVLESQERRPVDSSKKQSGPMRIMIALANRPGITARQLGVRAQLSSRSGTFKTYVAQLRSKGHIRGTKDGFWLTESGIKALGAYDALPEGKDLLSYWLNELGQSSGLGRMLSAVADVYPASLTKEDLGVAAKISHTSGTFKTYLAKLRTLELVECEGQNIKASSEFFGGPK